MEKSTVKILQCKIDKLRDQLVSLCVSRKIMLIPWILFLISISEKYGKAQNVRFNRRGEQTCSSRSYQSLN